MLSDPAATPSPSSREGSGLNAPSGAQCFPTAVGKAARANGWPGLNAPSGAQCFPTRNDVYGVYPNSRVSQCTFWCSVLSDSKFEAPLRAHNVVSMHLLGAQCFPTLWDALEAAREARSQCTFWCSVLSDSHMVLAYVRVIGTVSMHLLVLSAFRPLYPRLWCFPQFWSQCTFWCSVLSDTSPWHATRPTCSCLNAPSGAQCFPTRRLAARSPTPKACLNAPSGAQCFPTENPLRALKKGTRLNAPSGAQCFPTPESGQQGC